jgi:hypothetical protein
MSFFFYNKLTNEQLIKRISLNFEIYGGYISMQYYDRENNILTINNNSLLNNNLLYGKIVVFNENLEDIITKINEIKECRIENKIKYKLETILATKTVGLEKCKAYIIY